MTMASPSSPATSWRLVSPEKYRRVTFFALLALGIIIVSGAAVRLTGSGLGCSDWPTCEQDQFVASFEYHAMIEFVNRLFTGVVSIAVIAAVLGSLKRSPRRADLTRWSWGLVAGVLAQILLGAFVVKLHLDPRLVLGHFLLSMVLVWNAVVLHHRAGETDTDVDTRASNRSSRRPSTMLWMARALSTLAGVVLVLGTLVTGSGPHTGSNRDDEPVTRLPFATRDITRLHSAAVILLLAVLLTTFWLIRKRRIFVEVRSEIGQLFAAVLAQGAIGYIQFFAGVPVLLVALHILGSVAVWVTVLRFHLRVGVLAGGHEADRLVAAPS